MKKFSLILVLILLGQSVLLAQEKYERAYRIREAQFPEKALDFITDKIQDGRKIRFYKERDNAVVRYEVRFKKDRLRYGIEFDADGALIDVEFRVKEVDLPEDSFKKTVAYLQKKFTKFRIRSMQQQYVLEDNNTEKTLKNAFQNLLIPSLNYKFIVAGKNDKKYVQYEVLFDALGNFQSIRKSLPPNYDHVLY